jgi:hypothetical protein
MTIGECKMTKKTLTEMATIEFGKDLGLNEVKDLLEQMSKKLHANIHYVSTCYGDMSADGRGRVTKQQGSFKVGGSITRTDPEFSFDAFETDSSQKNYQKASAIRFNLVPGWEETDYKPGVLKLWEDTRKAVGSYFSSKSQERDASA